MIHGSQSSLGNVGLLPACFSLDLARCIDDPAGSSAPNCEAIRAAYWAEDEGGPIDQALERMPTCEPDQAIVDAAVANLPQCYSQSFYECLNADDPSLSTFPHCQDFHDAWEIDKRSIEQVPFCPDPAGKMQAGMKTNWGILGGAAVVGIALGFALGKAM